MSDKEKKHGEPRQSPMSHEELMKFISENDEKDPMQNLREMLTEDQYKLLTERMAKADEAEARLQPSRAAKRSNKGGAAVTKVAEDVEIQEQPAKRMGRPPAQEHPEIMTIEQCADYLQLHPQVVYKKVREGVLPCVRLGGSVRVKKSVLDAFLEKDAWSSVGAFLNFLKNKPAVPPSPAGRGAGGEGEAPKRRGRFSADID